MTDASRLRFFQWRAQARLFAETTAPGSPERAIAIQFRDALESAMLPLGAADRLVHADLPITLNAIYATSIRIPMRPALPLEEVLSPDVTPDPMTRITLLRSISFAVLAGAFVVTPEVQAAFRRAAFHDPDMKVRAWALHLIDPAHYPQPDEGAGEGSL